MPSVKERMKIEIRRAEKVAFDSIIICLNNKDFNRDSFEFPMRKTRCKAM